MNIWKILPDNEHKQVLVYFPFNQWIGKKKSTLTAKREIYRASDHHPRGYFVCICKKNNLLDVLI